jgi:Tfp pilus assembly protein PilO
MNKDQWSLLLIRLQAPLTILIAVGVMGFILIIYLFASFVMPQAQERLLLQQKLNQLEDQRSLTAKRPLPPKVTEAEIQDVLKQVPTESEMPRLLLSIRGLEKQTGVTIDSIVFGENRSSVTALENAISSSSKLNVPTANSANTPAASATTTAQNVIVEEQFTIQVSGTYSTVMSFLEQMHENERLITIKGWNWGTGSGTSSAAGEQVKNLNAILPTDGTIVIQPVVQNLPQLQLTLKCSAFYAPNFKGKFQELPSISVDAPVGRTNPTATDEEYLKLLQQLKEQVQD